MKKGVLGLALAFVLLIVQVPSARAAVVDSGKCGENVTWTLDDSGTLTISGTGEMDNYSITSSAISGNQSIFIGNVSPWQNYFNRISEVVIEPGVKTIGKNAFYACDLSTLDISDSVTDIGNHAFENCSKLGSFIIPESVTGIGEYAFSDCDSLSRILIPSSVASIGKYAFDSCHRLSYLAMEGGTKSIGEYAFNDCSNLSGLYVQADKIDVGKYAFQDCGNLKNITIKGGDIGIGRYSFDGCDRLEYLEISGTVKQIDGYAFHDCDTLKDVIYNGTKEQWELIPIDDTNDSLLKANIQFKGEVPPPPPPPLFSISKFSFTFPNTSSSFGYPVNYRIPLERFQLIYGNTALAKQKYAQAFSEGGYWSGSCYGIGTTAGMFATDGNGVNVTSFRSGAARPGDLKISDANSEWGLTLTQFIEAMQISQYSSLSAVAKQQNQNRLSALTSTVTAYDNGGGGPVLVCVYGPDRNGNYSGHALLAYHLDGDKLYVYDSNHPEDGTRAVTISNSGWSYTISDGVTWNDSNGDITYVPYETYLSDWTNRGHVQGSAYVSLVADVSDAAVTDSSGNTTAVFQRGKMVQGSKSAYPVTHLGITADGVSTAPPQVAVWLPADEVYTVTNRDTSKSSYEVSLYNVNQGVSVQTNAPSVTLLAEDATSATSAIVESTNCDYSITQVSGQNEVTLIGKTGRDKLISIIENGVSTMRSGLTASTSVTVNGKPVSVDSLPNNETAVNLLHGGFDDVTEDQYFYKPVQWAVGRGITNGTSATTFSPQNTCSRNHILTFLWRANGSSEATIQNPFTDINPNADFGKAAVWAYENGLVSGTKLNGGTPCTRSDVVTYLWKLAGRPAVGRNGFTDVPSDADYAQAVSWAVERGITKGTAETTFNPNGICTRGQIVTFLYRAYADN